MAAPSYVSSVVSANNTTSPKTLNAGTRAVGDLVVVFIAQTIASSAASHSVTDGLGNTYTKIAELTGATNRRIEVWYSVLTTGGACTVSVSQASGTTFVCAAAWATPAASSTIARDADSEFDNTSATTTQNCAPSGDIDTAADVILFAFGLTGGASGAITDPSGFTLRQTVVASRVFLWSRESVAALTDERAPWGTGNSTVSLAAVVSFKTQPSGSAVPKILLAHGAFFGEGLPL